MRFFLYVTMFIALVYQIHEINPSWLDLEKNINANKDRPYAGVGRAFQTSPHPELNKASFQYRQNIERTGVTESTLSLPVEKENQKSKMNYGIHGASKSSVSADSWGYVVPTDTSWIYHFDKENNLTWKFFVSESVRGIHGTAVLTKNMVYFGAYNGRFYALNRRTGKPVWVCRLGGAIGSSPVLWNDNIYIAIERVDRVDGYLVKIEARTGELIWRTDNIGEQAHSSPAIDPSLGLIYFGANNQKFFAVSDLDGSIKWIYEANGPIKGTSVVSKSCVLFADWSGRVYCLRNASGSVKWTTSIKTKSQSSPTLIREVDRVVVSSNKGHIWGLNLITGEVVWHKKVNSKLMMGSATAFKNEDSHTWQVVTTCGERAVCILDVINGEVIQKITVSGLVTSVPTIFNKKLYISTHSGDVEIYKSK